MASGSVFLSPFADAAAQGRLMLPVCARCGTVQYPLRDFCGNCLSEDVQLQEIDGGGRLLAATRLHRSADARFGARLPLRIGSVRLDAGPTVIAFLPSDMPRDVSRVRVRAEPGLDGAVLWAHPAAAAGAEAP